MEALKCFAFAWDVGCGRIVRLKCIHTMSIGKLVLIFLDQIAISEKFGRSLEYAEVAKYSGLVLFKNPKF